MEKPISESFLRSSVIVLRGGLVEESDKSVRPVERTQCERVKQKLVQNLNQTDRKSAVFLKFFQRDKY